MSRKRANEPKDSSKTYTSKAQFKLMVQLLERNPGLATNTLKGSDVTELWQEFSDSMNSAGPPRDVSGWKKVLADFKSGIKRKIADNRKELRETGGGPNNMVLLTDIEERVAILSNLYAAVDGNTKTSSFGAPSPDVTPTTSSSFTPSTQTPSTSRSRKRSSYNLGIVYFNDDQSDEEEVDDVAAAAADKENGHSTPSGPAQLPARKRARNSETLALLERQLNSQDNFNSKLDGNMEKLSSSVKDFAYYQKQLNKSMQNIEKLKVAELNEFKRHNLAMEKVALEKLKVKKQILELELRRLSDD